MAATPFLVGPSCAPSPAGEWGVENSGLPVVAWAGPDRQVTLSPDNQTQTVTLDGSGSFSNMGLDLNYSWQESGQEVAHESRLQIDLDPGIHTFVLQVTDSQGNLSTDTVTVTVGPDNTLNISASCGAMGLPALAFGFVSLIILASATRSRSKRYQEP